MKYRMLYAILFSFLASNLTISQPLRGSLIQNLQTLSNNPSVTGFIALASFGASQYCFHQGKMHSLEFARLSLLLNHGIEPKKIVYVSDAPGGQVLTGPVTDSGGAVGSSTPKLKKHSNLQMAWCLAGITNFTISGIAGYLTLRSLFNK
ncbi:hypothetical protein HYX58_03175 [Candidatus Dependentiae bacterium]|nr:hypothetical protein [Candidatus Dependentiae bacterium]